MGKNFARWVLGTFLLVRSICATPLAEQFKQVGYVEILDKKPARETFDSLYAYFDEFIEFLQTNPIWAQKLFAAKERFIREKDRNYYSTDVFGFYDESAIEGRRQIAFYYSKHFHEFICLNYFKFTQISEIIRFFDACLEIQKPYGKLFNEAAAELGLNSIFSAKQPPILLKVVKYLPSYRATKPHYDGTAFSLFLDSTDARSLLLSPYKSAFTIDDFSSPPRDNQNSILLIPGEFLTEFSIYPTPHFVAQSGKVRYATIAFAMRPHFTFKKIEVTSLPSFRD